MVKTEVPVFVPAPAVNRPIPREDKNVLTAGGYRPYPWIEGDVVVFGRCVGFSAKLTVVTAAESVDSGQGHQKRCVPCACNFSHAGDVGKDFGELALAIRPQATYGAMIGEQQGVLMPAGYRDDVTRVRYRDGYGYRVGNDGLTRPQLSVARGAPADETLLSITRWPTFHKTEDVTWAGGERCYLDCFTVHSAREINGLNGRLGFHPSAQFAEVIGAERKQNIVVGFA